MLSKTLVHTMRYTMLWGDMDAFCHMNNVRYFTYMEATRADWVSKLGYMDPTLDSAPIIVTNSCTYIKPAEFPDELEVRLYIGEPGNSSFMTFYELERVSDNELVAEGKAKIVWYDYHANKAVPFPEDIRRLF